MILCIAFYGIWRDKIRLAHVSFNNQQKQQPCDSLLGNIITKAAKTFPAIIGGSRTNLRKMNVNYVKVDTSHPPWFILNTDGSITSNPRKIGVGPSLRPPRKLEKRFLQRVESHYCYS